MTFAIGHVEGGTGAGRRIIRPDHRLPWTCECREDDVDSAHVAPGLTRPRVNDSRLVRCPDCGRRRP